MTTASMSLQVIWASARARTAASRTSPAMETSPRVDSCLVWPMPTMATRSPPMSLTLQDTYEVLLEAGAGGGVSDTPVGLAPGNALGDLADADQATGHDRVGRQ